MDQVENETSGPGSKWNIWKTEWKENGMSDKWNDQKMKQFKNEIYGKWNYGSTSQERLFKIHGTTHLLPIKYTKRAVKTFL